MKRWWEKYQPSDKWYAAATTGVGAIVSMWIGTGQYDAPEQAATAALVPALIAAYWISDRGINPNS